jgi:hypothetical protein
MRTLLAALAAATILTGGSAILSKADAATLTNVGSLAPLTKSYTPAEKVGYWRRHYRRGYYGYGYPYYGYGYYRPYYGYGYRPYGYYGGWGWGPGRAVKFADRSSSIHPRPDHIAFLVRGKTRRGTMPLPLPASALA